VRAESGVEARHESLKTIQEQVKTRTFSAKGAEKIRHPREFQSYRCSLRCRDEGFATRRSRPGFDRGSHRRIMVEVQTESMVGGTTAEN
jgi:hypothetical protein